MPRTILLFHAHPDDEAIATGGTIARAKAEGHRVVLVVATRGEEGEHPDGLLGPDETLGQRREAEQRSAALGLGIDRLEFLGYRDSGMAGEATNDSPDCFARADREEAAVRLARILAEEAAEVLVIYDDHGGYGHPDHIQVHHVGVRAAEIAGTPRTYEVTMNRDHLRRMMAAFAGDLPDGVEAPDPAGMDAFGSPEDAITTTVDVREYTGAKRAAMAAHASQLTPESFFLAMPDDAFAAAFGAEWFIRRDDRTTRETWLFDDPD